jgi:hypothetical protein
MNQTWYNKESMVKTQKKIFKSQTKNVFLHGFPFRLRGFFMKFNRIWETGNLLMSLFVFPFIPIINIPQLLIFLFSQAH